LRTIFTRYLDINAVPRYGFFEILHHFAGNPLEKEKLQEFLDPEEAVRCMTFHKSFGLKSFASSQEDLYEYAQMVRRTIKEVLEEFRSVRIPLDYIFDVFPPLRPREFSIASSVKVRPPLWSSPVQPPRVTLVLPERNPPLRCNGQLQNPPESSAERSVHVLLVYPCPR
jgi:sulfite reductase alpha subunit-like flavoprotein